MRLTCCGQPPKLMDKLRKTIGHQRGEETLGYYKLYQCPVCGERHWEFI